MRHFKTCSLRLERVLWSSKPRPLQLTVFTQLTIDRVNTLFNQCSTFQGPLSAAVYLALIEPDSPSGVEPTALSKVSEGKVKDAVASIQRLHAK